MADTKKTNRVVQISINTPLLHCAVYHADTIDLICRWIVDYGNIVNNEQTETTIVQTYRSTGQLIRAFKRKASEAGWTAEDLGQKRMDILKLEYARSSYPRRWTQVTYSSFEHTCSFFKLSQQVPYQVVIPFR